MSKIFFLPSRCPFCGAKEIGGSNTVRYYKCGSYIWIEPSQNRIHSYIELQKDIKTEDYRLKGHTGVCFMEKTNDS